MGEVKAQTEWTQSVTDEDAGVTYIFESPVEVGRYWNDDIFVVQNGNDIVIDKITPNSSIGDNGRVINGASIQPGDSQWDQGFDSNVYVVDYNSELNVDPAQTEVSLVISENDFPDGLSLVKAVSNTSENVTNRTSISDYSILTIVSSIPAENAFRPSVSSKSKESKYSLTDLSLAAFKDLPMIDELSNPKDFFHYTDSTIQSWHTTGSWSRGLYANNDFNEYGDYRLDDMVNAFLTLHSDASPADKLKLLSAFVQMGLDYNGTYESGERWPEGTKTTDVKPLMLIAGMALYDENIKANVEGRSIFDNAQQYVYGDENIAGLTAFNSGSTKKSQFGQNYNEDQIGLPEWVPHQYSSGTPDISSDGYRGINSDHVAALSLFVEMIGDGEGREVWGNEAFFDYGDRSYYFYQHDDAPFLGAHSPTKTWKWFYENFADSYRLDGKWKGRPEIITNLSIVYENNSVSLILPEYYSDNGSPIVRTDIRFSSDGENWTEVIDYKSGEEVHGLRADTFYYFQARHVNELGQANWSFNKFDITNQKFYEELLKLDLDIVPNEYDFDWIRYDRPGHYIELLKSFLDGVDEMPVIELLEDVMTGVIFTSDLSSDTPNDTGKGESDDLTNIFLGTSQSDKLIGGKLKDSIFGKGGDDLVIGRSANDIILGGEGNDEIRGGAGSDEIRGGKDSDSLNGGIGDDFLYGGAGDDVLYGNEGSDALKGKKGNDIFIFSSGIDTIIDFDRFGDDKIDLRSVDVVGSVEDLFENHLQQAGENVEIVISPINKTVLLDTDLGDLSASDFLL
ncbi:MAG: hypothetical protein AB3N28_02000 [Kordiimonas sp.]